MTTRRSHSYRRRRHHERSWLQRHVELIFVGLIAVPVLALVVIALQTV